MRLKRILRGILRLDMRFKRISTSWVSSCGPSCALSASWVVFWGAKAHLGDHLEVQNAL